MSDRMTDERLAEIANIREWDEIRHELLQALKAERERISELEAEHVKIEANADYHADKNDELMGRISELEAGIARIAAEARDKGAYTWAIKLEELNDE